MKSNLKKDVKGSKKARLSAARLAAVQAVYQMIANDQGAGSVIEEYKDRRFGVSVDGEELVTPDEGLFSEIVSGVEKGRDDLQALLSETEGEGKSPGRELLLQSVLLCGAFELGYHRDTDIGIIINDYLEVAHAFFEGGEARVVNGTLDRIGKALRSDKKDEQI